LAYADLPPCGERRALRLFVADKLLEAGITPAVLMKAQGFDPRRSRSRNLTPIGRACPPGAGGKVANRPATTLKSRR
jgi:hypothetical protein